MKTVEITTDGACLVNPGPGGWACLLRCDDSVKELVGSEPMTTNNRMELTAVIEALKALEEPCAITLNTDSQYVQRGVTEWMSHWKANGWRKKAQRNSASKEVLNKDLWIELDRLTQLHKISWKLVKGHASHIDNIRCDKLAQRAAREQISSGGKIGKAKGISQS